MILSQILRFLVLFVFGALLCVLNFPLPWLIGGIVGSIILTLFNQKLMMHKHIREVILSAVGLQMGGLVDAQTILQIKAAPILVIILLILMPLYIIIGAYCYHKIMGISKKDSFFCSVPGLLSYVVIVAEEQKCDIPLIVLSHAVRLLLLTIILPLILIGRSVQNSSMMESLSFGSVEVFLSSLIIIILLVFVGRIVAKTKLPAVWLWLGFLIAGTCKLYMNIDLTPPPVIMVVIQLLLGSFIMMGFTRQNFFRPLSFYIKLLLALFANFLVIILACVMIAAIFHFDLQTLLLAFSPGGLEAMVLISISLASNPILVSAMNVLRMVYLSVLIPIMMRYIPKN